MSECSPGPVKDGELLVRTLFVERLIGPDGHAKPLYFRSDPTKGGLSVDRMCHTDAESLVASKKQDGSYRGFLQFMTADSGSIRALRQPDGTRLFCMYDSATNENRAHADICQNVYFGTGTEDRKHRMMDIAWRLRSAFDPPKTAPPTTS